MVRSKKLVGAVLWASILVSGACDDAGGGAANDANDANDADGDAGRGISMGIGDGELGSNPADGSGGGADGGIAERFGASPGGFGGGSTGAGASGAGGTGTGGALADSDSSSSTPAIISGGGNGSVQSGVLTAGAWDDNLNFEHFLGFRKGLVKQELAGLPSFTLAEHRDAQERFSGGREAHETLDVALVIDTTGSMGDEIAYLQQEFTALSDTIERRYPDAEQRWSLVLYRDDGDLYKVRWFDFREDASEFRRKLAQQDANGGGDFPEAPDAALEIMNQLSWRNDGSTARLAFLVADAPHHGENADAMADAIRDAGAGDVHIYPIASSGIDDLTEFSMRAAAQLSGGRYLFLTDDSGVGGAHAEPSIPCYFVSKLDDAILRMVDIEMSGSYREPTKSELIRTGGDPQDGACKLSSGDEVDAF